jgi:hypothetical protein
MAGRFVGASTTTATPTEAAQPPANLSHKVATGPANPDRVSYDTRPKNAHPQPLNGNRGNEGFSAPPPDEGGHSKLARADSFAPLTAGEYDFDVSVNSIIQWDWGTVVQFKVQTGPDGGREIDFQQTPPSGLTGADKAKALAVWRRTIINAYGTMGLTWDPAADGSWTGWAVVGTDPNTGDLIRASPYDIFFVRAAPDGMRVPIMLTVHVSVQSGYEKFYKVTSIKVLTFEGAPVQAPMPRKVPGWIADGHGWIGKDSSLNGKADVVELDYKQIPLGHCGMPTLKDIR